MAFLLRAFRHSHRRPFLRCHGRADLLHRHLVADGDGQLLVPALPHADERTRLVGCLAFSGVWRHRMRPVYSRRKSFVRLVDYLGRGLYHGKRAELPPRTGGHRRLVAHQPEGDARPCLQRTEQGGRHYGEGTQGVRIQIPRPLRRDRRIHPTGTEDDVAQQDMQIVLTHHHLGGIGYWPSAPCSASPRPTTPRA